MFWTPAFAGVTLQETFYEIIHLMASQKIVTPVKTGVQRGYKILKGLNSGFCRNAGKACSDFFPDPSNMLPILSFNAGKE
jgi:hypothetical protein